MQTRRMPPGKIGLYDPRHEHDSCGVSFVANLRGVRSNALVRTGLTALTNLEHRGATGAESDTGDGAGILLQVPDALYRAVVEFDLPDAGHYATGIAFMPTDDVAFEKATGVVESSMRDAGLEVLGWRDLPVEPSCLGNTALAAMPRFRQLFVTDPAGSSGIDLDRKAFVARKRSRRELVGELETYFASLSSRTVVYKGMLTTPQLSAFFPDLLDPRIESALLIVHSRFSTNTFPAWSLAHPYRFVAHNGEINTVQGNENWMRAREAITRQRSAARPRSDVPDLHTGIVRHGPLRRGARAAAPRRISDPSRHVDDDPGGVGEPRHDAEGAARLLPVPCVDDGAVGRPGERRVHRRRGHRRGARPQRAAAEPVLGDRRRPRRHGLRGRRDRHRSGQGRGQGPTPARQDVPDQHGRGSHRQRRRDQVDARRRASRTASGSRRAWSTCAICPGASTSCSATTACCAASRCSGTPTRN